MASGGGSGSCCYPTGGGGGGSRFYPTGGGGGGSRCYPCVIAGCPRRGCMRGMACFGVAPGPGYACPGGMRLGGGAGGGGAPPARGREGA